MKSSPKKNKRVYKPVDRKDIERAMKYSSSNKQAARILGVSYPTYKKYAELYKNEKGETLFNIHYNRAGKGIPKMTMRKNYEPGLMDILEGRINPTFFSPKTLKRRVIEEGYLKEECCRCGFREHRVLDRKVPLLLNFKDGNKRHWELFNLEFLCYNCYFLCIGDVFEQKQIEALENYTALQSKAIDLELPAKQEELIRNVTNFDNRGISNLDEPEYRPDDYGNDLISFSFRKK